MPPTLCEQLRRIVLHTPDSLITGAHYSQLNVLARTAYNLRPPHYCYVSRSTLYDIEQNRPVSVARVLIIDDADDVVALLKQFVERSGAIATTVSQPSQTMSMYAELDSDIVMLDPSMRGMDGMAIIEWLAQVGYVGHLIVMSAYPDAERVHEALAHAGSRISVTSLPKPFRWHSLHAILLDLTSRTKVKRGFG